MKWAGGFLPKAALLVCLALSLVGVAGGKPARAAEPIRIGTIFSITGWAGFTGTPQNDTLALMPPVGPGVMPNSFMGQSFRVWSETSPCATSY